MVDEADNVILRMLREIRSKQDEHDARFEQVDARFDHIDKELEDVKFQVTYGLGVSSLNHLKAREVDHRLADFDKRLKRLEEQVESE